MFYLYTIFPIKILYHEPTKITDFKNGTFAMDLEKRECSNKHGKFFCQIRTKLVWYSGKDNYEPDRPEK